MNIQQWSTMALQGWIKLNFKLSSVSCAIFRTGLWATHVVLGVGRVVFPCRWLLQWTYCITVHKSIIITACHLTFSVKGQLFFLYVTLTGTFLSVWPPTWDVFASPTFTLPRRRRREDPSSCSGPMRNGPSLACPTSPCSASTRSLLSRWLKGGATSDGDVDHISPIWFQTARPSVTYATASGEVLWCWFHWTNYWWRTFRSGPCLFFLFFFPLSFCVFGIHFVAALFMQLFSRDSRGRKLANCLKVLLYQTFKYWSVKAETTSAVFQTLFSHVLRRYTYISGLWK